MLGLTAVFDVLDGEVARRAGKATRFGAFYDSTLDRIADGALLGGLLIFYASDPIYHNVPMVVVSLLGIIGAFLTSYTRARAESLGIDAKVGMIQRPERIVLLATPQAFFGLTLDGYVLMAIVTFLALTSWITVIQRMSYVHRALTPPKSPPHTNERPGAQSAPVFTGDRVAHARPRRRGNHVHCRRREHPPRTLTARRVAHTDGDHPARQAHRRALAADPGLRATGGTGRPRVRRMGSDS
jgi:CDP-diacylglycerol--glycerol-3-phosphate 3-phosphatidyltransferase